MTQRLNTFLAANLELSRLSAKVQQLRALQSHYERIAPASLLRASHVIQFDHNVLVLSAKNSAVAAKLRQMTPELVSQLKIHGCEVTGIQVRVQVNAPPIPSPSRPSSISPQGKQQLQDLATTLADSPLKNALQRLSGKNK